MTRFAFLLPVMILAGCAPEPENPEVTLARSEAQKVIAAKFPDIDPAKGAKCVLEIATEDERTAISLGALLAEEATIALMLRPETAACLS